MHEPLEEAYLNWLCAKVVDDVDRSIWIGLLTILHRYEFVPLLVGDHNRAEEGLGVRQDFLNEVQYGEVPEEWLHIGCSVFEMLLALASRAAWQTPIPKRQWFWKMLENLRLYDYRQVQDDDVADIENILYNMVWRTYDSSGYGGLFPLDSTEYDQRTVEIWYQLSEYVTENELV